ncbi:MAG: hypothetical protein GY950_20670 [bacterium]|nr:hypothetical protein [bacterium]
MKFIFTSHFISMLVCALIVSTVMAFIRYDEKKDILKYGLKLLIYMVGGVIIVSWLMHFL